jgi:hypothetical protein
MVDREERYFFVRGVQQKLLIDNLEKELDKLPDGSVVGIEFRNYDEYLLWALTNQDRRLKFVHVNTNNPSAIYEVSDLDAVFCLGECKDY